MSKPLTSGDRAIACINRSHRAGAREQLSAQRQAGRATSALAATVALLQAPNSQPYSHRAALHGCGSPDAEQPLLVNIATSVASLRISGFARDVRAFLVHIAAAPGTTNADELCLNLQGVPMTNVSEKATKNRIGLQPARNADAILDHLEKMISRTAELGFTTGIQGMGRQYWIERIDAVTSEITLLSSQKRRADLLRLRLNR